MNGLFTNDELQLSNRSFKRNTLSIGSLPCRGSGKAKRGKQRNQRVELFRVGDMTSCSDGFDHGTAYYNILIRVASLTTKLKIFEFTAEDVKDAEEFRVKT